MPIQELLPKDSPRDQHLVPNPGQASPLSSLLRHQARTPCHTSRISFHRAPRSDLGIQCNLSLCCKPGATLQGGRQLRTVKSQTSTPRSYVFPEIFTDQAPRFRSAQGQDPGYNQTAKELPAPPKAARAPMQCPSCSVLPPMQAPSHLLTPQGGKTPTAATWGETTHSRTLSNAHKKQRHEGSSGFGTSAKSRARTLHPLPGTPGLAREQQGQESKVTLSHPAGQRLARGCNNTAKDPEQG